MTDIEGSAAKTLAPWLRLLVLQPTPFCNIDCSYCYLSNRASSAKMSLHTLDFICQRVFGSPFLRSSLDVAWHGGEPLVVRLSWYESAIDLMAQRCPTNLQLQHCFQTNGLLVNDAWVRFFSRIGAKVGLSIDGPEDLHDANRRTRQGAGTHEKAMRAARLMQEHGFKFHVITVLTERTLDEPDRLFGFYIENGIREVGLNIEEIEGRHDRSSLRGADIETRFRRFIRRFFDLTLKSPGLLIVREFEEAIQLILNDEPARDQQNVPFSIVSVGYDGAISTFSPELLGSRHPRFESFSFGDVATHSLPDLKDNPLFRLVAKEIQHGVESCERSCQYFNWCGGGAPANKLFENGTFNSTETLYCHLMRKVMLDEILSGLGSHLNSIETETSSMR